MRDRAHRHHRRDGEAARAEVGSPRPPAQPFGQQPAHVREVQRRGAHGRVRDVGELGPGLARLPGVGGGGGRQRVEGADEAGDPGGQRTFAGQVVQRRAEPVDELGEPAEPVDVAGLDVVERQRRAQPALALHRDPEQQPVEPGGPGVLREAVEPVRAAVRRGQPPPDAGAGDEVAQPVEVVAVEAEAAPDGAGGEQVEDLGRREPGVGELQQTPGDVQQRVHLPQRAVGEPDRQPVARMAAVVGHAVGIEPEDRRDERGEGLDVRAGDRGRRAVPASGRRRAGRARSRGAPRPAGAGRGRRAPGRTGRRDRARVGPWRRRRAGRAAGAAAACAGGSSGRGWWVSVPGTAARRSCSSRTSRPSAPSRGLRGSSAVGSARRAGTPPATCAIRFHSAGEGCGSHRWTSRPWARAVSTARWSAGQAGGAEQREPLRQGGERGIAPQRRHRGGEPLRRIRGGDPRAQRPPHLRLPPQVRGHVRVVAGPPRVEQFGAVRGVGGEEAGQVGDHRVPAARAAQVGGERGAPRPPGARVDDLHQRPHRAGGMPRVVVRGDAGGALHGGGHDLAR